METSSTVSYVSYHKGSSSDEELAIRPFSDELGDIITLYSHYINKRYNGSEDWEQHHEAHGNPSDKVPPELRKFQAELKAAQRKHRTVLFTLACHLYLWQDINGDPSTRQEKIVESHNDVLSLLEWMKNDASVTAQVLLYCSGDKSVKRPIRDYPIRNLFSSCPDWIHMLVLAQCVITWCGDPMQFLPCEYGPMRLPSHKLKIDLPSQLKRYPPDPPVQTKKIEWFSQAPSYSTFCQKIVEGNDLSVIPITEQATIYFNPEEPLSRLLVVFADEKSIQRFSEAPLYGIDEDENEDCLVRATLLKCRRMILNDAGNFLSSILLHIHSAKFYGPNDLSTDNLKFMILAEDYLRQMPIVLRAALKALEDLVEQVEATSSPVHDQSLSEKLKESMGKLSQEVHHLKPRLGGRGQRIPSTTPLAHEQARESEKALQEDIEHIISISESLQEETNVAKIMMFEYIKLQKGAPTSSTKVLAGLYVPMSLVTGYLNLNKKVPTDFFSGTANPLSPRALSFLDMSSTSPATANPSNKKTFWTTSLPLIGFTFLAPKIVQLLIKIMPTLIKYRCYWPAALLLDIIGLVLFIFTWLTATWASDGHFKEIFCAYLLAQIAPAASGAGILAWKEGKKPSTLWKMFLNAVRPWKTNKDDAVKYWEPDFSIWKIAYRVWEVGFLVQQSVSIGLRRSKPYESIAFAAFYFGYKFWWYFYNKVWKRTDEKKNENKQIKDE